MIKKNRWILVSPQGQAVKAIFTSADKGQVYLDEVSQSIVMTANLLKADQKQLPHFTLLETFKNGQVTHLSNGFKLIQDEATPVVTLLSPQADEDEDKKPLVGYFKKSAIGHVSTVLVLMLLTHFLVKKDVEELTPPTVTLIELEKPKVKTPPVKVVAEKKKVVKKTIANKTVRKSVQVASKDNHKSKEVAFLKGLQQTSKSQANSQQVIKSAGQNSALSGGGLSGQGMGGAPAKIGTTGMRAAQAGGGSLSAKGISGYGSGLSGGSQSSGLKIISNQRGRSLPSGMDEDFSAAGLDRDQIIAVINKHRGEITYCYEQALKQDPRVRGKVAIQFMINPNGLVAKANVAESSANSNSLESCMVARLRSWKFPKPIGSVNVDVLYPFHLAKLGQN